MIQKYNGLIAGIAVGVIYGLLLRVLSEAKTVLTVMSISFMIFGPLLIGYFTIRSMNRRDLSALQAFLWPFASVILGCLVTLLFKYEGLICIVMYLPVGLILSGIGGLIARAKLNTGRKMNLALLVLPLATHVFENNISFSPQQHQVQNSIAINGSAAKVWDEIKSVKTITRSELANSWVHEIGFPRPLDAEIDVERVGGVRTARFERGLVFNETVDEWKPDERLSFRIDVDPKDIPPTALDEHVTIGGPFFDVLHGTYQIEKNSDGTLTLKLESQFRLSTHFNFYASLWTDLIMHQIQSDILSVIKQRVEAHGG